MTASKNPFQDMTEEQLREFAVQHFNDDMPRDIFTGPLPDIEDYHIVKVQPIKGDGNCGYR
jgi:hypothetical protein